VTVTADMVSSPVGLCFDGIDFSMKTQGMPISYQLKFSIGLIVFFYLARACAYACWRVLACACAYMRMLAHACCNEHA
jgi:hypothetical protein